MTSRSRSAVCVLLVACGTLAPRGGQSQSVPSARPGPRSCHSMAWSPLESAVLVLGGARFCGRDVLEDSTLWSWNGQVWSARRPAGPSPGAREDALLVADPGRNQMLLYGGRRGSHVFEDTWGWDGTRWQQLAAGGGPGPVEHAAAAFDERRGRLVVFGGGFRSGAPPSGVTWEWDGRQWSRAETGPGPSARVGHSMAFVPGTGIMLYGGFAEDRQFRDLWRWNGERWDQLASDGPTETEGPGLSRWGDSLIVVGAGTSAADGAPLRVWIWRGKEWSPLGEPGPPKRIGQGLASDPARRRLFLFGGFAPVRNQALADLWVFDGTHWRVEDGRR